MGYCIDKAEYHDFSGVVKSTCTCIYPNCCIFRQDKRDSIRMDTMSTHLLPPDDERQQFVAVSPMAGGFITLPERFFVSDANENAMQMVPSMAFLITHPGPIAAPELVESQRKQPFRMLFDLGLRDSLHQYSLPHQAHLQNRQPYRLGPGIASQLQAGGIHSDDIDIIFLSHVHYDHHGDPAKFTKSTFVVGNGSLQLLSQGLAGMGSHQHFDPDLLPLDRTVELPPSVSDPRWKPIGPFERTLDIFGDGTVYVLESPGHLPGHINLLCRIGPEKFVCLCGDAYHDKRLLTGERNLGYWAGDGQKRLCIHLDPCQAIFAIEKLRILISHDVDVIAAHDYEWFERNKAQFFPNKIQ